MKLALAVAVSVLSSSACALFGPSCVEQREEGPVTEISGSVGAGELVVHRVQYDTRGSQNDARLMWGGQTDTTGPQLRVYATRATCEMFALPANTNAGECAVLASGGWTPQGAVSTIIVTHGRGNPERLGTPPEYKLWVTSDKFTGYTMSITYFYGPDC